MSSMRRSWSMAKPTSCTICRLDDDGADERSSSEAIDPLKKSFQLNPDYNLAHFQLAGVRSLNWLNRATVRDKGRIVPGVQVPRPAYLHRPGQQTPLMHFSAENMGHNLEYGRADAEGCGGMVSLCVASLTLNLSYIPR
jgi:hypothetical protein